MRAFAYALIGLATGMTAQITPAAAAGDVAAGKALAERSCSSCHLVSPEQTHTTTEAPPFASIAARRSLEEIAALAGFLSAPHPPMPPVSLTRQEIADVLAYIASLK